MFGHARFDAARVGDQLAGLGSHLLPCSRQRLSSCEAGDLVKELIGIADQAAGDGHVGMGIDQQVERVLLQLRQDPRRVAKADCLLAAAHQTLQQVIDRQIAGRAGEHLLAASDRLAD